MNRGLRKEVKQPYTDHAHDCVIHRGYGLCNCGQTLRNQAMSEQSIYRIKHNNGTYFKCWTAIGPCFGATKEQAATMSELEAKYLISSSWKMDGSLAEPVEEKKEEKE